MIDNDKADELIYILRRIYASDPRHASEGFQKLLNEHFSACSEIQKSAAIRQLIGMLRPIDAKSEEVCPQSKLMDAIYASLDQLLTSINTTMVGNAASGDQTIGQVIAYPSENEGETRSIESYLKLIHQAFLLTQEAHKSAASAKVKQILDAIDPDQIAAERSGGIKIGPLKKAQDFDTLKEKIQRIQRWYTSGRFMEDYLKEFEKNCRKTGRT